MKFRCITEKQVVGAKKLFETGIRCDCTCYSNRKSEENSGLRFYTL